MSEPCPHNDFAVAGYTTHISSHGPNPSAPTAPRRLPALALRLVCANCGVAFQLLRRDDQIIIKEEPHA